MFSRLALVLILVPSLDFLGVWWFAQGTFGTLVTLALVFGSAVFGAFLARNQIVRYWDELNRQLDRGEEPSTTVMHGFLIFCGGMLLIIPGLITDLFGLLLLVPPIRSLIIAHARLRFLTYRAGSRNYPPPPPPPDIIDID